MKYKYILIALLFSLAFGGCSDFGDMNVNPNAPESIENSPELILTGIQRDALNTAIGTCAWSEGNVQAQYFARIVFTDFDRFEWGSSSSTWTTFYTQTRSAQSLYNMALKTENTSYQAVCLILKSWMFQILTDVYGEVPYSEALQAKSGNYAPAYDTQEDIYKGILADLATANTLLAVANPPVIKGDIINNGNIARWRKLANSLRLRALMRLSNVDSKTDIDVAGEITTMLSNPTQYPTIDVNADNSKLTYTSSAPNVHPRSSPGTYRIGSLLEWRMSETAELVLKAYDDPRMMRWYDPTENSVAAGPPQWAGMKNGLSDGTAYSYKGGSAFLSSINLDLFYSPNELEGIIMTSPEVWFIKAEAALRYPAVAAVINAKTAYETGIQRSFEYWKVTMPADYLARTSSNPEYTIPVAFDGQIATVMTQKWLSLFYNDYQGFLDFKRTGLPAHIKPGPDANLPTFPSRFMYVSEEQALNKANYDAAVSRQGPDNYSTPVWWENK